MVSKKHLKATKTETGSNRISKANMGFCAENLGEKGEISSPFLRLPREVCNGHSTLSTKLIHCQVRDKIYDELLIARLSSEDQIKYNEVVTADKTPCGEFGRANALDIYEQETCLMPGGNRPYPYVSC